MPNKPTKSYRRFFQFSLSGLIITTTVLAFAFRWYAAHRAEQTPIRWRPLSVRAMDDAIATSRPALVVFWSSRDKFQGQPQTGIDIPVVRRAIWATDAEAFTADWDSQATEINVLLDRVGIAQGVRTFIVLAPNREPVSIYYWSPGAPFKVAAALRGHRAQTIRSGTTDATKQSVDTVILTPAASLHYSTPFANHLLAP